MGSSQSSSGSLGGRRGRGNGSETPNSRGTATGGENTPLQGDGQRISTSSGGTSSSGANTGTGGTSSTPPRTEFTAGSETGYEVCLSSDSLTDLSASASRTPTGVLSPVRESEGPDRMVRPTSVASVAPSLGLEMAALPSDWEEIYGTPSTSVRTSQMDGSTNYESASMGPPASSSRTSVTTSFKSLPTFHTSSRASVDIPLSSESWGTPTQMASTPYSTPRVSTYGTVSGQNTNLEPPRSLFYDSAAASVVGSPPVTPTYPTVNEPNTEHSTAFSNLEPPGEAIYGSVASSATPRGSTYGVTSSGRSTERPTSLANLRPRSHVFYDSVAASIVGTPPWGSSSSGGLELPEIPSESRLNSPAASLVTLGSSERGVRRTVSPALSSVPSVIPSISSLAGSSEEALPVRLPPSTSIPSIWSPREAPRRRSPSESLSLSSTPSPLMPSAEQIVDDVATPTTLNIENTETLSVLSPFPRSITPDAASVVTPASLVISQSDVDESDSDETISTTTSFTQTSTSFLPPAARVKSWASTTDLSYNSSVLQPSPSIPSVTFREEDEEETQGSFETSFLRPSTVLSTSPRTSIVSSPPLRPPGPIPPSISTTSSLALPPSVSSASTPSTLRSLASPSSPRVSRPLPRVPISLATESLISASLVGSEPHLPLESTPVTRVRPISPPSSQPSLQRITPAETLSPRRTATATPSRNATPFSAPFPPTPSGSIIVSITTPQGSGSTRKSSLHTERSEVSAITDQRDLAHDFDRLVDDLQTYNFARGLEHQGLVNDVKTLKNEVRGLAGLVRMGPAVATPAVLMVPSSQHLRAPSPSTPNLQEEQPGYVTVDRAIGGSSAISTVFLDDEHKREFPPPGFSSGRSTSEVGSVHSYLSSHHSDDDVLQIEEELLSPPIHSPIWPAAGVTTKDPVTDLSLQVSSESDSSSLSSSPYASSSELSEGGLGTDAGTIQPSPSRPHEMQRLPESVEQALEGIKNQLRTLDDSQNANINLLESMQRPGDPEEEDRRTSELLERLGHIEDLLRAYLEQAREQQQKRDSSPIPSSPMGFNQVPPPPPLQRLSVSTSDSGDSLHRLRTFLGDLVNHVDNDYDRSGRNRMSMPPLSLPTPTRPISRQRADDILQPLDINISPPPAPTQPQSEIPRIEPFNFLYGDSVIGRGERPRSASPMSVDKLPALRHTASVILPVPVPVPVPGPKRRRRIEGGGEHERRHLLAATTDAERLLNKRRIKRDIGVMKRATQQQQRQNQELQQPPQQQQQIQLPPRQVALRSALKQPSKAVPQISGFQPQVPLPNNNRIGAVPAERMHSDSRMKPQNQLPSRTQSWYKPRDDKGASHPIGTTFVDPSQPRYLPVANAPAQVVLPPLGPSMNMLRDQRIAQLATVDQQRELMRYMKGLNQWLETDVRNRREEFHDVFQTVEELRRQIKRMRKKGGRRDRDRERDRRQEGRTRPRSRTRPETTIRVDPNGHSAPTTPVGVAPQPAAPQPQRWTAVPALLQPLPVHSQQQQRMVVPPGKSSRARASRASFVPAAIVQPQAHPHPPLRAQPSQSHQQSQPTIILLPAGARGPAQAAYSNLLPLDWQYSGGRNNHLERNGTGRSRR